MAKVSFTKLYNKEMVNQISVLKIEENAIEVKHYLPLEKKMSLINELIAEITEETNYLNPLVITALFEMLIVVNYTNISFSDKQKGEGLLNTYDSLKASGIILKVKQLIPDEELQELTNFTFELLNNIMAYRNSANAIIANFIKQAEDQKLNTDQIIQSIKDNPEVLELTRNLRQAEYHPLEDSGTKQNNDNVVKMNNN